ncbi:MAG: hypothetical protein ACFFDF_25825 [Candidatus Odinarchaeota archaeon]
MSEKRDQLIGTRFTRKEKEIIENFVKDHNSNISDFVREAIFSHMNNLSENVGVINLDKLIDEFKKIKDSANVTLNSIDTIVNLFQEYRLTKFNYSSKKTSFHIKS